MTAEQVNNALTRSGITVGLVNRTILLAFQTEMRNKSYGDGQTVQAFHFFRAGYNARRMV